MDHETVKAVLENILFVADAPLSVERAASIFEGQLSAGDVAETFKELRDDYEARGLALAEVAEGWRLQTRPEYAEWVTRFFKMEKGQKLSRASLEVLAIIAYRQPITRAEIDDIRGVDSGGVLRGLIEKSLVKTMGRRKAPGKPMMYGTTPRFLEYFGLARLADLPTMEEFSKEFAESLERIEAQEALDFEAQVESGAGLSDPADEEDGDGLDGLPGDEPAAGGEDEEDDIALFRY